MAQAANNTTITSIAAPQAAVGGDCTHVSLWTAETGGSFLQSVAITGNPDALALGDTYRLASGALVIEQPVDTGGTEAMARRAAAGRVLGGVWVQYHSGAPGTAGTANVITALGRTNISQSQFTIS